MNLNAYDNVKEELDKHKTWYSPKFRRLYSREIKFRMFYKFMKRWNETIKRDDYFLAISTSNTDGSFSIANRDNYGRLKVSFSVNSASLLRSFSSLVLFIISIDKLALFIISSFVSSANLKK